MKRELQILVVSAVVVLGWACTSGSIPVQCIPQAQKVAEKTLELKGATDELVQCVKGAATPTITSSPTAGPSATATPSPFGPTPTASSTMTLTPTAASPSPTPTQGPALNPPTVYFWRGIKQANAAWSYDAQGRHCALIDTTIWYVAHMDPSCHGAPSCDTDHFPCMGPTCSWRPWDDVRGPLFYIGGRAATSDGMYGPVQYWRSGYGGLFCAAPGAVVSIDTCPWPDQRACTVPGDYDDFAANCPHGTTPVPVQGSGCYSKVEDVQIRF